ncbi:MAG: glycoside hydrolase family 97 N-terminal domain-containing protein, partial [Gammaproteobacteria bacterium]
MTLNTLLAALPAALALATLAGPAHALHSPDGQLDVKVEITPARTLAYSVTRQGQAVLLASPLGLELAGAAFTHDLTLAKSSPIKVVSDSYRMAVGKRRTIAYRANEQVLTVVNAAGQKMDVAFRVSNDGVAFRYVVPAPATATQTFVSEATGFAFAPDARAFLQPMSVAKTGFARTNPSYEEYYHIDEPVGTPSPMQSGWVFPALFRSGPTWVALTEANMDGTFHASRLQAVSSGGVYRIGQPMAQEGVEGKLLAEVH